MRGACQESLFDLRPYAFPILDDLICPEPRYTPSVPFHRRRASIIGVNLESMMIAIDFDNDLKRYAGEIGKVRTDGMLPPEFEPMQATPSKKLPADSLRAAAIATQFSGSRSRFVLHSPSPNLSPKGERNMKPMIQRSFLSSVFRILP